jgi:hypothetical protein
MMAAVS